MSVTSVVLQAGLACTLLAAPLHADVVDVTFTGEVEYNGISPAPLGLVDPGNQATISFQVDSDSYVDSATFPTRGYVIDQGSFTVTMGSVSIGLQSPFPAGQTAYFVLRNNDPGVDGFFISTTVDGPTGLPLDQAGSFGQFTQKLSVTYTSSMLPSVDILDAQGSYDFTGLTVFRWTIDDGPFDRLGVLFGGLTISTAGGPWADLGGGTSGVQGVPSLLGIGDLTSGSPMSLELSSGPPSAFALLWIATAPSPFPALGGTVHAFPFDAEVLLATDALGALGGSITWPAGIPAGSEFTFQFICQDGTTPDGLTLSNGVQGTTP